MAAARKQRLSYAEKFELAELNMDAHSKMCEEVWDEHGFPEDDLPETIEPEFNVWVPEPYYLSSVVMSEAMDQRLGDEMRLRLHQQVAEWIQPFGFKSALPIGTREDTGHFDWSGICKHDPRWSGVLHEGKQGVKGKKHFLSLAEGHTLEELFIDGVWCLRGDAPSFSSGISVPIGYTGLEAKLMAGTMRGVSLTDIKRHPKFPRYRYKLVAGYRRKPVFKLMPKAYED